jgi:hypothetical protein
VKNTQELAPGLFIFAKAMTAKNWHGSKSSTLRVKN